MNLLSSSKSILKVLSKEVQIDSTYFNIPKNILEKIPCQLHRKENHPVNLISKKIQCSLTDYVHLNDINPVVTKKENFDDLLFPYDHPGKSRSDTYYFSESHLLRTHTSAHQLKLLQQFDKFTLTADVYRKDQIDKTHYPIFHQMEGIKTFHKDMLMALKYCNDAFSEEQIMTQECHSVDEVKKVVTDLKSQLTAIIRNLYGDVETRWINTYFPFTQPSFELEIKFRGEWLEVLGCGVIRQEILNNAGKGHMIGWAFGIGLERLAMSLFDVPDIRLFWSKDPRFMTQFERNGLKTKYQPFSSFPAITRDISFFSPNSFPIPENDLMDVVRNHGSDLVESVYKFDEFHHEKINRKSFGYRIVYQSMER
ncbi:phenylalanyl-tRNA synthetase [Rozella allomycis CSF55]|uniref:phenylalanine--tRNA ligase n=1 Tax=Rozella allomycis (strain CSF55) TaxID=988480 RepID=A0A075AYY3_ROZAC|nr:Phenylalanyl-tRNA synthetase domain-containing protein [Rozella allomycis CSF55]RKP18289.1 phenylalanyl-tRNA synthetase [Rozella allomycis CSF55]|eukprot:EPZ35477.1 Phenylalanyl-tRNA synthetase domain-containing protein [Rozella allomycis CSF55]